MSRPLPPFKSLIAFDAAARLGSFSRAAEELSLTQSAISQQLLKLEELLGQSLFFRNGKGVGLTGAGVLLHATVSETLSRLASGLEQIEPYKNKDSVLIACPPDFAHGWLTPRLAQLRALHPSMEIWIISKTEVREIDRIDVDLVISRRPIHTADVECAPLLEDESIAICGLQTAARLTQIPHPKVLEKAPILLLENEPAWGGKLTAWQRPGSTIVRGATMDDRRLLLEAVVQEMGIALVSRVLASQALRSGSVVHLSQVPSQSMPRFWLMRSRLSPRTALANVAFKSLCDMAQRSSI